MPRPAMTKKALHEPPSGEPLQPAQAQAQPVPPAAPSAPALGGAASARSRLPPARPPLDHGERWAQQPNGIWSAVAKAGEACAKPAPDIAAFKDERKFDGQKPTLKPPPGYACPPPRSQASKARVGSPTRRPPDLTDPTRQCQLAKAMASRSTSLPSLEAPPQQDNDEAKDETLPAPKPHPPQQAKDETLPEARPPPLQAKDEPNPWEAEPTRVNPWANFVPKQSQVEQLLNFIL